MRKEKYNRNRKKLPSPCFVRGTRASAQGTDTIAIENSAGVPFSSLEIVGKTTQPIVNQFEEYKSYFENIDNYTSGGISGVHAISLPENWQGKKLTYLVKETASIEGVELYLSDGESYLFASTAPLLDKNGTISEQTASAYTHLILTGIYPEDIEDETGNILSVPTGITEFWQGHSLEVTSELCPDFPAPIQNANDSGMSVVLHGDNLFNQEEMLTDSDFTKAEYNGFECIKLKPSKINHIFPCFIPKGTYTLTLDLLGVYGRQITVMFIYEDGTLQWWRDINSSTTMTDFSSYTRTLTAAQNIVSIDFRCFQVGKMKEYYLKNIMVNTGNTLPYEPYFHEEITIPTSVEDNGTSIWLPFTAYDRLIVDRVANSVTYAKKSGVKVFTGEERFTYSTYSNDLTYFKTTPARLGLKALSGNGYCSHLVPNSTMFFNKSFLGTKEIAFLCESSTVDEFKTWVTAQYEAGTPLTIVAEYEEAESIDITKTELGQALLSLCVPRGQNGELSVGSSVGISAVNASYYSMEAEDKVELTVSYQNESGDSLKDESAHSVRRGSRYQIIAPHIEGYERISSEVCGVAEADTKIELIYKKA